MVALCGAAARCVPGLVWNDPGKNHNIGQSGRLAGRTEDPMGLFSRAHDIMQAKANKALDAAEKPDEMLELSYEKMLEQITQVRRALVEIAASRKRIELQAEQLQHSADHLQDQARTALAAGREDLAREALSRKAAAQGQVEQMAPQHQQLVEEEGKLTETLKTLQARVNQFRTQKETLKAQYSAAKAMTTVNEGVAGISKSIGDSGAALTRAQDKIANMQARSGALDELLESGVLEDVGSGHDDIQHELDQLGASSSVDQELAALKAGMAPAGALDAGSRELSAASRDPETGHDDANTEAQP
jgi:phage shock protein A